MAFGALLLVLTNTVAMQVAGSAVMWLGGYRRVARGLPRGELKRNVLSVPVLCCLAVLLGIQLQRLITTEVCTASVRGLLNAAAATHKGAYLTEVRFQRDSGRTVVVAVYHTPAPFTPEEVGALEPRLPLMPAASSLELRIRSIPVTVSSRVGCLFSSEDLPKYGRSQ